MSKTGDGYSASTYRWGHNGTNGERERLEAVDHERDARVGWTKGGRLKIGKKAPTKPASNQADQGDH